jgi:hypothetical protein
MGVFDLLESHGLKGIVRTEIGSMNFQKNGKNRQMATKSRQKSYGDPK